MYELKVMHRLWTTFRKKNSIRVVLCIGINLQSITKHELELERVSLKEVVEALQIVEVRLEGMDEDVAEEEVVLRLVCSDHY